MIKQISQYPEFAIRTCKILQENDPTPDLLSKPNLAHAGLGIASELFELAQAETLENFLEECGDLCWYLAIICVFEDLSFSAKVHRSDSDKLLFEQLLSEIKRRSIYQTSKISKEELQELVSKIIGYIEHQILFASEAKVSLLDVLNQNIEKLKQRYPEKYTDELAVVRLDKQNNEHTN